MLTHAFHLANLPSSTPRKNPFSQKKSATIFPNEKSLKFSIEFFYSLRGYFLYFCKKFGRRIQKKSSRRSHTRSNTEEVIQKKSYGRFLKNFLKFTGKNLLWSLESSNGFVILIIPFIFLFEINRVNTFPALTTPFSLIFLSNLFIAFEVKLLTDPGKLSLAKRIVLLFLNYLTKSHKFT